MVPGPDPVGIELVDDPTFDDPSKWLLTGVGISVVGGILDVVHSQSVRSATFPRAGEIVAGETYNIKLDILDMDVFGVGWAFVIYFAGEVLYHDDASILTPTPEHAANLAAMMSTGLDVIPSIDGTTSNTVLFFVGTTAGAGASISAKIDNWHVIQQP